MNPINDEMLTKETTDVNKLNDLDKSNITSDICESLKSTEIIVATEESKNVCPQENEKETISTKTTKIDETIVNTQENKEQVANESKTNTDDDKTITATINEESNESSENKRDDDIDEKKSEEQTDSLLKINNDDDDYDDDDEIITNEGNHRREAENKNQDSYSVSEPASEEETEDFEEEVEDVEIPGDEEVDEIIVPDDAEAEDLTDDRDNEELIDDKTLHEEDEENNENGEALHEEDTSKSCDVDEKDEDSSDDKKSSSKNDAQEDDSSSKHSEEDESELVALEEEGLKDATDCPLEEESKSNEPQLDEESNSQAAATYDPLNCVDSKEQQDDDDENGPKKNSENENTCSSQLSENNKHDVPNEVEEEEDDEVQFVETRNSPICIESDDDDDGANTKDKDTSSQQLSNKTENGKRIITTATTTVAVPKNLIVTRTSARKSTAKPPQQNKVTSNSSSSTTITQTQTQIKNKQPSFSYLQKATNVFKRSFTSASTQRIVDCIELLDSSDEESSNSRNRSSSTPQLQKTPQKRTLLAAKGNYYKNNNNKPSNNISNLLPNNFPQQVKQQPKKPDPPLLPPPTPQSNFLNAVQLQPSVISGQNPPAFSALLSNKSVIIPNAFYGNPPSIILSPELELERRYARWLENFINLFSKPQFVATHSCFVFLQKALKYKDFVRIKALRANMNNHAQNMSNQINTNLMADLKTILLKNTRRITNHGRRLCELTCSSAVHGKAVTLIVHGISGKVTLKTCNMDLPKPTTTASSSTSSSLSSPYSNTNSSTSSTLTRKRQLEEDEDEYTPDKSKPKTKNKSSSENGDGEDSGEMGGDDRKRSLRTKRTKRLDNSFSYNEDDLLAEYEIDDEEDEKLVQVEIQRKIEQKRLEAQKQRQKQVKSFENAFIQAFARNSEQPTSSTKLAKNVPTQRIRLNNTATTTVTSIKHYTENNDAEDLLQATWIENHENDETQIISDDDEPKEHFIYKLKRQEQKQKQQQQQQQQDHYSPPSTSILPTRYKPNPSPTSKFYGRSNKRHQEEVITGDDNDEENNYNPSLASELCWPKNADTQMFVNGKNKDKCVICHLTCQRLVHHYVNEHRGCEVYNSRLSSSQIKLVKQGRCTVTNVSLYKNGQFQYEAFCIFCRKNSRFMLPYWYQHLTMHTGEYAYRCIGCGLRKPTRSLITQHQAQGCTVANGVAQDYCHDSRSFQIEAKVCNLCNYVQLHRSNIARHLHMQHNIKHILPKHIQTIVLLSIPPSMTATSIGTSGMVTRRSSNSGGATSSTSSSFHDSNTYVIDDDNDDNITYEEILPEDTPPETQPPENQYYNYIPPYMQAAVNSGNFSFEPDDAGEDLSFMICGMLDVQMNNSNEN